MRRYKISAKAWRPRPIQIIIAVIVVIVIACLAVLSWYEINLRPVSSSQTSQLFTVDQGSSAHQIADGLQSLGLIRSTRAFIIYVDVNHFKNKLQAGTYKFKPAMSSQEIAQTMANGFIDKNWITILPGKRLDQIEKVFSEVGYTQSQIANAFNPANYTDEPLVASLPGGNSLEGLLAPDSFERSPDTPASAIVRESIEETQSHLTKDITDGFAAQGLTTYQGITLASIVYQESGSPADEPTVAQVFLLRLKQGMELGSDVTAFYAAALAGQGQTLGVDSPYNTRLHTGLPPGPIGSITQDALEAVAHPANTTYLYFVAGDNGVIHFSHTEAEQDQAIKQFCTKQCS
ncbi:MAG: endolytic transglycosylase MltG [Candidatus Saccharimonadales bacterium]